METQLPPRPPPPGGRQYSQESTAEHTGHRQLPEVGQNYGQSGLPPAQYAIGAPVAQPSPPVQTIPSGNPFTSAVSSNPFRQEAVQPVAQDTYLHGSVQDRTY